MQKLPAGLLALLLQQDSSSIWGRKGMREMGMSRAISPENHAHQPPGERSSCIRTCSPPESHAHQLPGEQPFHMSAVSNSHGKLIIRQLMTNTFLVCRLLPCISLALEDLVFFLLHASSPDTQQKIKHEARAKIVCKAHGTETDSGSNWW